MHGTAPVVVLRAMVPMQCGWWCRRRARTASCNGIQRCRRASLAFRGASHPCAVHCEVLQRFLDGRSCPHGPFVILLCFVLFVWVVAMPCAQRECPCFALRNVVTSLCVAETTALNNIQPAAPEVSVMVQCGVHGARQTQRAARTRVVAPSRLLCGVRSLAAAQRRHGVVPSP